ncbi:MAG: S9 family peptidase [Ignavibacteriales bacterium]|nr:S9 family peptidase [Ignavibacteriales bacterium]
MNFIIRFLTLLVMSGAPSAQPFQQFSDPPVARKVPTEHALHGDVRIDNYAWLRQKSDPDVINYLEAENGYTEAVMKPTEELQDRIYQEILKRTKQTDLSVPYKLGEYWYYSRTEEGKQYSIYCRKKGSLEAPEEIVLELNELARGHPFLGLGVYQVSDDGTMLAYSLDTTGFRQYRLFLKNLTTGEILKDSIGQVNTAVWAADNKTLFYTKEDHAKRPHRFYRHQLGQPWKEDALLFEEKDELYRIWTYRSRDKQYVFLMSASAVTNEARYLLSMDPFGSLRVFLPREDGHEYDLDHREGLFYIRTNKGAKNFRLVATDPKKPSPESWKELLPHRPEIKLENVLLFKDHAVFVELEEGLIRLVVHDFHSGESRSIAFPEPVYSAFPGANPEYDVETFRYNYQSFITPSSVYEYDTKTRKSRLLKQTEVLGDFDTSDYTSERIWTEAEDGSKVPISLVYRKGLKKTGQNPLLLYGYGAYGISIRVAFSIPRLSLIDRGVIFALAHVRGGGDLGERWREEGRMLKKKNTFTDFIACAEYLIEQGYTSKDRLAVQGGSAGGLLIGAVLNMRPDLFKAAHLAVPFVDVLNTMLDDSLPLTVGEFLEWGNPKKKSEYDYLRSYCPYTNLHAAAYPSILVTTSLNDSQVMYWEPVKYVAKLRSVKMGNNVLLLKTNMGAGHGGASGRYDAFKEQAFILSFLLTQLGIEQ